MTSKHLIDPELLVPLENFPPLKMTKEGLAGTRAFMAEMLQKVATLTPPFPNVETDEQRIPGPKGAPDVRVLIYRPKGAKACPAYLDIHGGGYVIGSPDMSDARNKYLADELKCVVVSVDYRLAPETPHPGPVEDCYAALLWLHANAAKLGADKARIAIGGPSAGGGLTAALALLARDRGEVPIIHQQLIYPMIDDRAAAEPHPYTGEFAWTQADNNFGWSSLLGQAPGGKNVSPYAAAARAENLKGLPPAFISVGTLDLFLEEDMEYARRLTRAGVPVELHLYPGAFHGFDVAFESRVAKTHARDQVEALRAAFARTAPK